MRDYELLMIISPEVTEEELPNTLEKVNGYISAKGGAVTETNHWGIRRLAYPIKHFREGNYILEQVQLEPESISELEGNLRILEKVLRHVLVRKDQ